MLTAKSPDAAPAAPLCVSLSDSSVQVPWQRFSAVALCVLPLLLSGCSMFSSPGMKMPSMSGLTSAPMPSQAELQANYVPVGGNASLPSSSFNQEVYQSVRNAKANNSIVLQVLDDDVPIRILPLPGPSTPAAGSGPHDVSGERSVFVSTLLTQTGVMRKLGKAQAALYRPSPDNYEGVRMDVLFVENSHDVVRPESDYALRPGDRLVIRKDSRMGLASLIDYALGR